MSEAVRTLPHRSELTPAQTWDLEGVFATVADFERAYQEMDRRLPEMSAYAGKLGERPEDLLAALQLMEELTNRLYHLSVYASLRRSEDATNQAGNARYEQVSGSFARFFAARAFVEPELLELEPATLDAFIAAAPELAHYRHFFAKVHRQRGHVRSSEVEALLAEITDVTSTFYMVSGSLENADLELGTITDSHGNAVALGQGNLLSYLTDADRGVRRAAWTSAADAYISMRNTFASSLAGSVKSDVFYARARNYPSTVEAILSRDAIPPAVFYNLIDTVWRNMPTWRRYFNIQRRILGVEQLHEWDVTAPLARRQPVLPFDEGMQMICASLEPLGAEYVEIVRNSVAERWIDRYPNIGKGGGAFSGGSKGTFPFISLVYQDDFRSVSVLTHEFGHSLHSYYAWQTQSQIYCDYSNFTAETASNMHQALLGRYLMAQRPDPDVEIALIEERITNHLRYFFTMPILARFEHEMHSRVERGEALTAESMTEYMADLYADAYGDALAVDRERVGITWARFPHLYQPYYVFQYATGIAAAAELARQVAAEGEPAARRFIDFLKTGDSVDSIEALRIAGVDMLDPTPVQAAFDILAGYIDRLDELTRDW